MCAMPSMVSKSGRTAEPGRRDSLPRVADDFRQLGNDVGELLQPQPEVFLVATPVAERAGVKRLPHLLGACGLDRPLRLVETHAGFLERQPAMRKDPADLRLEVGDGLL